MIDNNETEGHERAQIKPPPHYLDEPANFGSRAFERALKAFLSGSDPDRSVVRNYLETSRGIPWVSDLQDVRFCADFCHSNGTGLHPAMVAAMRRSPTSEIVAIHATFLMADGSGKADLTAARKVYGKAGGAAIWLTSAAPLMILAEFIEKALAVRASTGAAVVSAYSQSNVRRIDPPPGCTTWLIAADRGAMAEQYARDAGRRLTTGA